MTLHHCDALRIGTKLGNYDITKVLQADRFSILYCALNDQFDSLSIIQEYFPSDFARRRNEDSTVIPCSENTLPFYNKGLESFIEEGELLSQIEHQGIVQVQNIPEINGTAYLIMNYVDGTPLSRLYECPLPFTDQEIRTMLFALLTSLKKVHGRNIFHGSIQADNILIKANGSPVLVDFAKFKFVSSALANDFRQQTPTDFQSLEAEKAQMSLQASDDLYALGTIMYRSIMHCDYIGAADRIGALKSEEPYPLFPLSEIAEHRTDKNLLETIDWMLLPNKRDRPVSADQIFSHLQQNNEEITSIEEKVEKEQAVPSKAIPGIRPAQSPALWAGGIAGIAVLYVAGFGLIGEKTATLNTLSEAQENEVVTLATEEYLDGEHDESLFDATDVVELAAVETIDGTSTDYESLHIHNAETNLAADIDEQGSTLVESETPVAFDRTQINPRFKHEHTIEKHLTEAQQDFAALKLGTPPGDNAMDNFNAVLAIKEDTKKNSSVLTIKQAIQGEIANLPTSKSANIASPDYYGNTAPIPTSAHGSSATRLIDRPENVDRYNLHGRTALINATIDGKIKAVKSLLGAGANPNSRDQKGNTSLILAAANGQKDIAELLLNHDVDANIQNNDGWTALMFSAWSGHTEIVKLLLTSDADTNLKNNKRLPASSLASTQGHWGIVTLIETSGTKNEKDL